MVITSKSCSDGLCHGLDLAGVGIDDLGEAVGGIAAGRVVDVAGNDSELYLGVNDNFYDDDSGPWLVEITPI